MSLPRSVVPLESNPEVFTRFAHELGLSPEYAVHDIYSLTEPDLMAFLPRPMKAIVLLFPINDVYESSKDTSTRNEGASQASPIWFKQTVKNACGLYALLHSLANNPDTLQENSKISHFLSSNPRPDNRFADEKTDEFIVSISELYNKNSSYGQTAVPQAEDEVNLHFITYVKSGDYIFEMDGRRNGANLLGTSSSQDLLEEPLVRERVEWYMNNADENMKLSFSLLGLAPSWD
ncbi:ubiquitin-specific protease YUH1 [Lachancea thermotolerans CBS 6340]|uniref:Ubiquitin carboxyl-terminal hydrolase n=1 Tax=Lachancea thermotolerans (strain ATCC 56472 / CBS 6340 / NRRL Y-8284) TaxID=559295 RepID=C5DH81_LACTC|nr:KLTH0E02068p [Lachancea thermotolerans CBS 6340]CAR23142.1 KLTH0E02068p [Lachancea thermotolerans CBS 6340]